MTSFEQEIYAGIVVVVAGGLLTATFRAIMKGYNCLKVGQVEIVKSNHDIALTLKAIEGRFENGEQWMSMHHEADKAAFLVVDRRIDELREIVLPLTQKGES